MCIHRNEPVKKKISPTLLKLLKGKSCFYLKSLNASLERDIGVVLEAGGKYYRQRGWALRPPSEEGICIPSGFTGRAPFSLEHVESEASRGHLKVAATLESGAGRDLADFGVFNDAAAELFDGGLQHGSPEILAVDVKVGERF